MPRPLELIDAHTGSRVPSGSRVRWGDSTTARRFTSPLKLFEAMASGRPIVASDLPSLREVLRNEENALLVPPGDTKALAAALQRLADEPETAARLAARAAEEVKCYSWDERGRRLGALLRSVRRHMI